MTRFVGFQDGQGVAVLDTATGELVYCPFHDDAPRVLRPAVGATPEAEALPVGMAGDDAGDNLEAGHLAAGPATRSSEPARPASTAAFRPERRLQAPRPLVIRYPDASEVAAIKRARMARTGAAGWTVGGDGEPPEPEEES